MIPHRRDPGLDEQRTRCELQLLHEVCDMLARIAARDTRDGEQVLSRLVDGTYGYCADCHHAIDIARLEALPFAIRCAACAHDQDPLDARSVFSVESDLTLQ